jgi:hypothetical protein
MIQVPQTVEACVEAGLLMMPDIPPKFRSVVRPCAVSQTQEESVASAWMVGTGSDDAGMTVLYQRTFFSHMNGSSNGTESPHDICGTCV